MNRYPYLAFSMSINILMTPIRPTIFILQLYVLFAALSALLQFDFLNFARP